jgi:fimbrial chaperone protein
MLRLRTAPARLAALALATLAFASPVLHAGAFSVTPVRIYMKPNDRAVALTIVNEGTTEVALQADMNSWTQQPDGSDVIELTEDMIVSPPIIKLAPKARQVVRLARLQPPDLGRQLTYRLIVREVPEATAPRDKTIQVPIALALSMPVFITPPHAARVVDCTLSRTDAQALEARCANTGTAYAQIREILVSRGDATLARFEGGTYILPGASRILAVKGDQAAGPGPAQMEVRYDDGKTQRFEVTLP